MARISQRWRTPLAVALGLLGGALVRAAVRRARRIDFEGRVAIVTGGSRGLGLLIAEELGRRGAKVAICGRNHAALGRAEQKLRALGIDVLARPCDLADRAQVEVFVERVLCEWGRVDLLVNNAGVILVGPAIDFASLDEAMRSNFWSAVNTTLVALPYIERAGRGGRIVNVVSIGGRVALPHMLGYTASKFALMGLSEGLHAELSNAGIPVTTVIPGPMRTGSFYNAQFRGNEQKEFAWFSVLSSLPLFSINARRAARAVVRAAAEGRSVLHLGLSARVLALLHGVAPRTTMRMLSATNRLLPQKQSGDGPHESWRGREIGSPLLRSRILRLGNKAARRYNEAPPDEAR